jgi:hypothetical protein
MNDIMVVRRDDLVDGITDSVKPLKARIEELEALLAARDSMPLARRTVRLEAGFRSLEADLKRYGGHTSNCAYHLSHYKGPVAQCDCGWTEKVAAFNPRDVT